MAWFGKSLIWCVVWSCSTTSAISQKPTLSADNHLFVRGKHPSSRACLHWGLVLVWATSGRLDHSPAVPITATGGAVCRQTVYTHYIPIILVVFVVFVLRLQLSPTQMKCKCNAFNSTYIPYRSLIRMRFIWSPVS